MDAGQGHRPKVFVNDDPHVIAAERGIGRWVPGFVCRAHVRPPLAAQGRSGGGRPGRHPRAAGHGLRGAGRTATRDRFVHHHRLPARLRRVRPLEGPGPRSRLFRLADDLRCASSLARRRRQPSRHCARRDAGGHRRADRGRHGRRPPGVRRRPPVQRGPGGVHERPRVGDHRRPAPQTLRLFDRRRGIRPRGEGVLPGSRRHGGLGARDRVGGPGDPPRAPEVHPHAPGRARRDRAGDDRLCRVRSPCARRGDRGQPPAGDPTPIGSLDEVLRRRAPHDRRSGDHAGLVGRHDRHLVELWRPAG